MKLLRESPIEFLESISKPPDKIFISEITGQLGKLSFAASIKGILCTSMSMNQEELSREIQKNWEIKPVIGTDLLDGFAESVQNYLDNASAPVKAVVQPVGLTEFTIEVHRILSRIPIGTTLSYGEIAELSGKPGAARAVGNACGRNRSLLVVPCHRALAKNGLGGFGGGLDLKKRLLSHEGVVI